MATRESNDNTSQTGKSYTGGQSSTVKNIQMSKDDSFSRTSLLAKNASHVVEIHADHSVFDTSTGTFLFPGRDFNPGDLYRK